MSLQDDITASSQYLAPRKSPSRQTLSNRRSKASLHAEGTARGTSLAHELAAALMPEPTASSRLLADEFGIEFDEGAEGIDDGDVEGHDSSLHAIVGDDLENLLQRRANPMPNGDSPALTGPDASETRSDAERTIQKDPLAILNIDLENTNLFIENLRRLDTESSSAPSHMGSSAPEPPLERLASDVIRRINDSAREREGQVRELREFEREFKRIAGQAGGNEVLGELDELERIEGFAEEIKEKETRQDSAPGALNTVVEEEEPSNTDWELDPHRVLGDEEPADYDDPDRQGSPSPVKESTSLPPPPLPSIPTPASTIVQLAYMRTLTQSLVTSLSTVVEHTQVTGAATAEAGRKIRALKNKIGDWRAEWESAEKSMERIEKWETGGGTGSSTGTPVTAPNGFSPLKGRKMKQIMQEELTAFELVLAEAGRKTQAIMAAS